MNRNVVTALILSALIALSLPLIYTLFVNVILPTAWDEEPASVPSQNTSSTGNTESN